MVITFQLRFHTHPGQSLWLAGAHPLPPQPVLMHYLDAETWQVVIPLADEAATLPLHYAYTLRQPDGSEITDWPHGRQLVPATLAAGGDLTIIDSWNHPGYVANAFYTEPFRAHLLAANHTPVPAADAPEPTHIFRVKAPLLAHGQTLALIGEAPLLGQWRTEAPLLLSRPAGEAVFTLALDLRAVPFPCAYKYGVYDVKSRTLVRFEEGANRSLTAPPVPGRRTAVNDGFARLPADTWHGAGVAVPVFSLRSSHSFGTGEFADLKLLADWGRKVGLKLIQLLPVNDTQATHTWRDSYPYAAISVFALHPLYLNLADVANAKNRKLLQALEPERQRLNALDAVDYEAVLAAKLGFLRKIFPSQKATTLRSKDYQAFYAKNESWLLPYAVFSHLRDRFGTADFNQWPEHRHFNAAAVAALAQDNDEIRFHCFVQYHLHRQLQAAAAHLHEAGLILKGDIAIGVYRHSADTWQQPELYHLDQQAGAPPDPFAAKGQNWGFPTYNWDRMAADGFAWWKQRFAQMGYYFDAFRIDHILGFFRIWSSPAHAVEGILGRFVPCIPIEPAELTARGLPAIPLRLTRPFINDAVLHEIFGDRAPEVIRDFLVPVADGQYLLRPEFATQRQIADWFSHEPQTPEGEKLRTGLFDLVSNVILFEDHGKFHFRFAIEQTSSFRHLPPGQQAALRELYVDYFFRRQDEFWRLQALRKLPALKRVTEMLICGEDLGLVPACVPEVMQNLGFLSLEIQRMPKNPGQTFSRPADAPYLSVVTPSTHDMSTIRGWWEEDAELTQSFYNHELDLPGAAPAEASPQMVEAVIRQHLASPAMWTIFQLQDWLGIDGHLRRPEVAAERINIPAIAQHYWRYRMHLKLENLLAAEAFNQHVAALLKASGR